MKRGHIVALLVAGAAGALVLSTFKGASRYVNFAEARTLSRTGTPSTWIHVVGHLAKDSTGQVQGIQEAEDHRSFSFLLEDMAGESEEVRYPHPMPTDFLRAEQVVIIGYATETYFQAQKILLKCPSKYETGLQMVP